MEKFLRMFLFLAVSFGSRGLVETAFSQQHVERWINHEISNLMHDYQWLHQNPELSFQETETARFLADALRQSGFHVVDGIGGHGVVGLLQNGFESILHGDKGSTPIGGSFGETWERMRSWFQGQF